MKLYAGHQFERFEAPIDYTYSASAHSAETVISWYKENEDVGIIAVISQVVFPIFVTFFVLLFLIFIVECEPYERGKRLQNELNSKDKKVKANAEAGLLTKYVAAVLFHLFTLGSDGAALGYYAHVPKPIREYYCSEPLFWITPIIMIVFDIITFILFIIIPPIYVLCKRNPNEYGYKLIYSVVSPFSCIASHSYHIVFAFIINPYHATSILLIYAIIAFINIQAFQKLFYFVNKLISGSKPSYCCPIENTCVRYFIFVLFFMFEFALMALSIALSITLIVKLPLSNAIDDAPNHLYVIYQASVTFFAALIAFQVMFRQTNSTFDVFIEAIDRHYGSASSDEIESDSRSSSHSDTESQSSYDHHRLIESQEYTKTWIELSDTEKEMLLAKVILFYLNKGPESVSDYPDELKAVLKEKDRRSIQPPPSGRKCCCT